LHFIFNNSWAKYTITSSANVLKPGHAELKFDFAYDGGKAGSGGLGSLYINSVKVGEGRIEKTTSSIFTHEGLNLGFDDLTTVSDTYKAPFPFSGVLNKITIELKNQTDSGSK
jgi:arylsulfatase